jgi:hypothetical protein
MALDIVCATDIRICSNDVVFSAMEVDMGMVADLGSLQLLPKIVGNQSWVKDVCLTGRLFGAGEALSQGFVSSICATKKDAMEQADAMARTIAEKSPLAVQGTKEVLTHARDHTVPEGRLLLNSLWKELCAEKNRRARSCCKGKFNCSPIPRCIRGAGSQEVQETASFRKAMMSVSERQYMERCCSANDRKRYRISNFHFHDKGVGANALGVELNLGLTCKWYLAERLSCSVQYSGRGLNYRGEVALNH